MPALVTSELRAPATGPAEGVLGDVLRRAVELGPDDVAAEHPGHRGALDGGAAARRRDLAGRRAAGPRRPRRPGRHLPGQRPGAGAGPARGGAGRADAGAGQPPVPPGRGRARAGPGRARGSRSRDGPGAEFCAAVPGRAGAWATGGRAASAGRGAARGGDPELAGPGPVHLRDDGAGQGRADHPRRDGGHRRGVRRPARAHRGAGVVQPHAAVPHRGQRARRGGCAVGAGRPRGAAVRAGAGARGAGVVPGDDAVGSAHPAGPPGGRRACPTCPTWRCCSPAG